MPFVLVVVGILMIVTGSQGTYAQFGSQVAKDFTGTGNFVYWIASLGAVGSVGYIDSLKNVSRLFMALIIISMVLANKGFFAQFQKAIQGGPVAPTPTQAAGSTASPATSSQSSTPSLKSSLQQPGGGGFWSYIGVPSPFGN